MLIEQWIVDKMKYMDRLILYYGFGSILAGRLGSIDLQPFGPLNRSFFHWLSSLAKPLYHTYVYTPLAWVCVAE